HNRDRIAAAVVCSGGQIEGPGGAQFDRFVRIAAGDYRYRRVHDGHSLAAAAKIAAKIGRLPGPHRVKSAVAMTGSISHRAHDTDRVGATVIDGSRRIE